MIKRRRGFKGLRLRSPIFTVTTSCRSKRWNNKLKLQATSVKLKQMNHIAEPANSHKTPVCRKLSLNLNMDTLNKLLTRSMVNSLKRGEVVAHTTLLNSNLSQIQSKTPNQIHSPKDSHRARRKILWSYQIVIQWWKRLRLKVKISCQKFRWMSNRWPSPSKRSLSRVVTDHLIEIKRGWLREHWED